MNETLDVLLLENRPGAGEIEQAALEEAGHRVHRCHPAGDREFACVGIVDGGTCPLDGQIDVTLLVRRGVSPRPTPFEDGVRCAIRHGTPIVEQIEAIATRIYGATGIDLQMQAQKDLERVERLGFGTAPVCMAKTQMSLSHDPALRNRPSGFILPVRSLLPSAGAGFVVALCGDMQRMPGLGKTPAFMKMDIDEQGRTMGLT